MSEPRIAVILAGGKSSRMGGVDKGTLQLAGRRLVEHVADRLARQTDEIMIAGRTDYGLGVELAPDLDGPPFGPLAGVIAAAHFIAERRSGASGFYTAPVDGPLLPSDLVARLGEQQGPAIAVDANGPHPTFAYWRVAETLSCAAALRCSERASLLQLAAKTGARQVVWRDPLAFANLNTPEDLAAFNASCDRPR